MFLSPERQGLSSNAPLQSNKYDQSIRARATFKSLQNFHVFIPFLCNLYVLCYLCEEGADFMVLWKKVVFDSLSIPSLPRYRDFCHMAIDQECQSAEFLKDFWVQLIWQILYCYREKAKATHSSTLAWQIPWTEEPGRLLRVLGSLRVGNDRATSLSLFTCMHWRRKWQPTPVFLTGESQGQGSLVGCRLWGHTESDTTEMTQQQQQQSILAWRIPWTEDTSGLQSMGLQRVGHD